MTRRLIVNRRRQSGITLLEILIAVVVLSIGLLGVAGLQLTGLKNGQQSYQRSQATALAYEIADRMRANRLQAVANVYQLNPGTGATATPAAPAPDCSAAACTGAQLAAWDVYDWYRRLQATLPTGAARIECSLPAACASGVLQTVTIIWDEDRTGAADPSCPAGVPDSKIYLACFKISFAP